MEMWDVLDENRQKTGRLHRRGQPLPAGDFHLVVHVWILDGHGNFLISKRAAGISLPLLWQCTGGSAVAGDDSLTSALKETQEEIGINLDPSKGELFHQFINSDKTAFVDVWVFRQDVDINDVVLCPEETCDAMWADEAKIRQLIDGGEFIPLHHYPYLDKLFAAHKGAF
ncbi:MAG: NUDIX domain-containing protein [Defluviitaleaceae bacterium]|nr:NUDIX domain-containing protein [Defluviitaleaceae bacterium]